MILGVKEMEKFKTKYEKPKIISCKDCNNYKHCSERSRLYPCRLYKPVKVKEE